MCKLTLLPSVMLLVAGTAAPAAGAPQIAANEVAPASAPQPSAAVGGGGTATVAAAAEDKKICKELPSSYTRMTEKVCLTKKQWKQVEEEAEQQ